jgi:alginate O-acetyltransferase complex protein AlgI
MSFTEVEFVFFLPPAVLVYWALPRSRFVQNLWLLILSALFYVSWNWRLGWVLIAGSTIDFLVTRLFVSAPRLRKSLLSVSLLFSLGTLVFFKYEGFFANSINALGLGVSVPVLRLMLPLGLSFYTLQRMGFVLDVYWDRQAAPRSYLDFLLFCCFFPQLTAGPISRGRELLPQLESARALRWETVCEGCSAFMLGFALKGWAADLIAQCWVDPVYKNPGHYNRFAHLLAVIGFPLQVFSDFAGYSLMAIGVALLFCIRLPANFDRPFLSQSLPELWRRWHITLNRWLFDYIFTPLTTSRQWFRGRLDIALFITFLASGLWHGAAWTFVAWGVMHGIGMIVQRRWDEYYRSLCRRDRSFVSRRRSAAYKLAAWLITMTFFVLSLIPFRANSIATAVQMARGLVTTMGDASVPLAVGRALLGVVFILFFHVARLHPFDRLTMRFWTLPTVVRGVVYGLVIVFLFARSPVSAGAFVYQQF